MVTGRCPAERESGGALKGLLAVRQNDDKEALIHQLYKPLADCLQNSKLVFVRRVQVESERPVRSFFNFDQFDAREASPQFPQELPLNLTNLNSFLSLRHDGIAFSIRVTNSVAFRTHSFATRKLTISNP
jgi:hypothetical protein